MAEYGEPLSDREMTVLEQLAAGNTNREIALELHISPNTVKVHLSNIYTKLGVASRTEATTAALQQGLVSMPGLESAMSPPDPIPGPQETAGAREKPQSLEEPGEEHAGADSWRLISFASILLLVLVLGALAGAWLSSRSSVNGQEENVQATSPFQETPIGESRWLEGLSLPQPRANMAAAAVGLDIYFIGGEVGAGTVNLLDIFDTVDRTWRSGSSKPTAVTDVTAAVLFGEIYVPGGRLADGRPTAVVEAYSPANDAWRPVTPLPRPIAGGLTLSDDGQLFHFGGWDGEIYLADVYAFDPSSDEWQTLTPMTKPRAYAAGDLISGSFMIVGGFDGRQDLDSCERFDPSQNSWSTCPSTITAHAGAGAVAMANNLLYIIGGSNGSDRSTAEVYDYRLARWEEVELPMMSDGQSLTHAGVVRVETRIYVMGGSWDDELVGDGYIFAPLIHRTYLPAVGD